MKNNLPVAYFERIDRVRDRLAGRLSPLANRELTRCEIAPGRLLSVPVVGGASALKRNPFPELKVADHADWQRTHDRTLDALFSRTPFFRHVYPRIRPILMETPPTVRDLNRQIQSQLEEFLHLDELLEDFENLIRRRPERLREIARQLRGESSDRATLFEEICRLGPDAIFLLNHTL